MFIYMHRYNMMSETLNRVSGIFSNLDTSPKWAESRNRWPEGTEGLAVTTGNVCIICAVFVFLCLYIISIVMYILYCVYTDQFML